MATAKIGKIVAHKGGGLYSVEIYNSSDNIDNRVSEIDTLALQLDKDIAKLGDDVLIAKNLRDEYVVYANLQIAIMNSLPVNSQERKEASDKLITIIDDGLTYRNEYIVIQGRYDTLVAQRTSMLVERAKLSTRVTANQNLDVWCADLSDGVSGRYVYPIGFECELWCFNYDAGVQQEAKYMLPPGNTYITPKFKDGAYNIPYNYTDLTAACMTFWNVAMEGGFAKFYPRVLRGILELPDDIKGDEYCGYTISTKAQYKVLIPEFKLRTILGEDIVVESRYLQAADLSIGLIDYFVDDGVFEDGDEVVIVVDYSTYDAKLVYGTVVGFYDNPKGLNYDPVDECVGYDTLKLEFSGIETPILSSVTNSERIYGNSKYLDINGGLMYAHTTKVKKYPPRQCESSSGVPFKYTDCGTEVWYCQGDIVDVAIYDGENGSEHSISSKTMHQSYLRIGDKYIPQYYYEMYEESALANSIMEFRSHKKTIETLEIYDICFKTGAYSYRERVVEYTSNAINLTTRSWESRTTYTDYIIDCEDGVEETVTDIFESSGIDDYTNRYQNNYAAKAYLTEPISSAGNYVVGVYFPFTTGPINLKYDRTIETVTGEGSRDIPGNATVVIC